MSHSKVFWGLCHDHPTTVEMYTCVHGSAPRGYSRVTLPQNEEIVALSEYEPLKTMLRKGSERADEVMIKAVIGISSRFAPIHRGRWLQSHSRINSWRKGATFCKGTRHRVQARGVL